MKQLSNAFIQALNDDEREYLAYATIELMDGTTLNLTNEEIWSGGFRYEEAVSDDNSFTAIGSAIMGSATLIINNIYEYYTNYDFSNARVSLSMGMTGTEDVLPIGEYKVDDTSYNGATIQLNLLDNMAEFDRPYNISTLTYPTTLGRIVYDACLNCGISAAPSAISFLNDDFIIRTRPTDETVTFRDIIAWAAAIAGCYAKINIAGELEFKWFNITALNAVDTDSPTFHPWDNGQLYNNQGVHFLYSLNSQNICTDDVVITGVTIHVKAEDNEEAESDIIAYSYTSSGLISGDIENDGSEYIILIENNQLIDYRDAAAILLVIGPNLVGLRFRKLNITQVSDPSIESGDVAIVTDRKLNNYKTLITRNVFSIGTSQMIVCGADTPSRSNASSNPDITKSYIEARKLFKKSMSATDDALNSAIIAAQAAHEAQESADSALLSAKSANNSANSALTQLSIVEDVAGTLNWIRENADFVLTEDTELDPKTIYFVYERGEFIPVIAPDINVNPSEEGWYVLDVASSQSEYIMAHLAVTEAGLWVLPFNTLSPHQLVDSAGYDLIDSEGNLLVDWSKDPQHADGYKALFASDGMTIYNSSGTAVAHYGTTITLGSGGQSRLLIEPIKLKMINSVDDEIYSIEPGKRSEHQIATTVVSYQDETEVVAHTYNIEDTGALDDVEPYTELTINDQTYTFSTGISVSVTEGVGVTVTITNDGVSAILSEMQYEDYDYVLTTDTTVNADKTYYRLVDNEYESVEPEGTENPSQEGWYEQIEVTDYYPCILSVVYLSSYVLTAQMDMRGQIEVTGEGNPVTIINEDWSDLNKTDTYFRATNKTKGISVGFGIGSGGENHGIWSTKLKNWMIYTNGQGAVTTRSSMLLRENGTRIYGYGTYPAGKLYCFGNNKEILRFASKTTAKTPASKRGLSFMIANGYYAIGSGKTISTKSVDMYLCGGTDASGKFIRSYPAYARKYNYPTNMFVTSEGTIGRTTSSSIRYKHDVEYLTNEENSTTPDEKKLTQKRLLKGKSDDLTSILDIPVVKFKFNDGYVTGEEDFDYTKPIVGLIADDVAKICPDCAVYIKDKDGNDIPETYNTNQLLVRMLYVMQQQEKRIQELEERISILEGGD